MRLIQGLSGIRTSVRQQVHSIPPSHRSPHLERHMLAKQEERLEREIAFLERRCRQCRQRVADIQTQMGALADREEAGRRASSPPASRACPAGARDPRRMARMTVEY